MAANGLPPDDAHASQPVWRRAHSHLLMLEASMTCLEEVGILHQHALELLCCGDLEASSHQIALVEDMICLEGGDILQQHDDFHERRPS